MFIKLSTVTVDNGPANAETVDKITDSSRVFHVGQAAALPSKACHAAASKMSFFSWERRQAKPEWRAAHPLASSQRGGFQGFIAEQKKTGAFQRPVSIVADR